METSRLRLRSLTPEDEGDMHRISADPLVTKYLGRGAPTRERIREKIQQVLANIRAGESIIWAVSDRESGAYLGSVCLWNWDKANFRAEVGYDLTPSAWGRGLIPEAMASALRFGFETMNLHSLEAHVHPDNQGSIRVLEKLGFQKEAHFRENHCNGGRFEDTFVYSLLKSRG